MLEVVNKDGVILSFGKFVMTGVTNDRINVSQSLRSQTNNNVTTDETRFSSVDIVRGEDPIDTVEKMNDAGTSYISKSGKVTVAFS